MKVENEYGECGFRGARDRGVVRIGTMAASALVTLGLVASPANADVEEAAGAEFVAGAVLEVEGIESQTATDSVSPVELPESLDDAIAFQGSPVRVTVGQTSESASNVEGLAVFEGGPGESATVIQPTETGARVLSVIPAPAADSTSRFEVEAGGRLELQVDQSIHVLDANDVIVGAIAPPWAVDAAGDAVPTSYSVADNVVTQTVDSDGAQFPIVADPAISVGSESAPPVPTGQPGSSRMENHEASGPQRRWIIRRSPAGCRPAADYPHPSSHNPGQTNVVARVTCGRPVAQLMVKAQLWENRFWGWSKIGAEGRRARQNVMSVAANSHFDCHLTATYRGTGWGQSLEGGRYFTGEAVSTSWKAERCRR